ncbi:3-oxoacyl-reductase [Hyaloscypha sp. PMI_1271]|nr:3-oxoacyl-reductase [Hyaloscypha sp. PMI_1271]
MSYSAIVTGGASGIGAAVCRKLASRGINLIIADLQKEAGEKLSEEVRGRYGIEAYFLLVNVALEEDVTQMVGLAVEKFGRLDYAANCAGICEGTWEEEETISTELFEKTFSINAKGMWLCQKYEALQMKNQEPRAIEFTPAPPFPIPGERGSICNISSIAGLHAMGFAAYTPTKFAVLGITKNGAKFYGPSSIRCNAVCPGLTRTAMLEGTLGDIKDGNTGAEKSSAASQVALRRSSYAHEQANVISFLLSPESSYVNGATIVTDGGFWDVR